jgi:gliding motility-associated-like protein
LNNTNIFPDQTLVVDPEQSNFFFFFGAKADITELVQNTGNANYFVDNFDLNQIIGGYCTNGINYAGWSIVVIYEDQTLPDSQVSLYEGLSSLFFSSNIDNSSEDLIITNFLKNNSGDSKLGVGVYNGSPNLFFGEALKLNGNVLSNFLNPPDNPFNGTNSYTGDTDLFNMDLDFFDVSNLINLGDTSATITFESPFIRVLQYAILKVPTQLPEPTVNIMPSQTVFCETENINLEIIVENTNATAPLPVGSPVDVFYENTNGDLVLIQSFLTSNPIPIDGSEIFLLNFTIPPDAIIPLQLTARVNLLDDGSVAFNENNPDNNFFTTSIGIVQPPVINTLPIGLSSCGNLSTNDPIDLTQNSINNLGLTNPEDYNIQYFTSDSNAQSSDNPIPNPDTFVLTSNPQDIFIRIENAIAPDCFSIESFTASYQDTPDIQQTINLNQCQENSETIVFDLTTNDAVAIGVDDPSNTNISYHETLIAAQNNTGAIFNPTAYPPLNNSQTIFIRAENATDPACFSTASFELNTFPVSINNLNDLNIQVCIFPSESVIFDLTENSSLALGNQNPADYNLSYYTSENDALSGNNPIPNPSAYENLSDPQQIWLRLEHINSPVACFLTAEFSISVANAAQVNFLPNPLQVCDTNNDGFAAFDLSQSIDDISLNNPDISVSFHLTADEAENNTNPISSPFTNTVANNQTLFFRTEETGNGCSFTGSLDLEVLANPILDMNQPVLSACAVDVETASFDLTDINASIILNNDSSTFEVAYFLSENEALTNANPIQNPNNFVNTGNPQTLWIRVSDTENCVSVASFELEVLTGAVISDIDLSDVVLCSETPDGLLATVDLTQFDDNINPNPQAETLVIYYAGLENFNAEISIENPESFLINTSSTTIIAEVVNIQTLCVSPIQVVFEVIINPLPDFELPETSQICIDRNTGEVIQNSFSPPVLDANLSETAFEFEWSLNGVLLENNTSSLLATSAGNYQVIATNIQTDCSFSQNTIVEEINPPSFNVDILSPAFSGDNRVEVNNIVGEGEFEFKLDDGEWLTLQSGQTTLIFEGISNGNHVITARDLSGCGERQVEFTVLGFSAFFTPNADGFNDYWNIRALQDQPDAKIFIFDRYGKLIYEANPLLIGWDGNYQGRQMPAQDYWFRVEFTDPQTESPAVFSGHITLKR